MPAMPEERLPAPFEVLTETEVDSRGRVSLGRAGAEPGRRYRVARDIDGVLLLTPVVSIPERELIVWENPALAERWECCKSILATQGCTPISTRTSLAHRRRRRGTLRWKIVPPGRGGSGGCTGRTKSATIKTLR